ncbi:MAG: hypothetical protein N4A49_03750 [Marinifilaceae bacterium]|jgi:hypothetical protein|nr:hypothetical protein [Marinifilaceae bacterium]
MQNKQENRQNRQNQAFQDEDYQAFQDQHFQKRKDFQNQALQNQASQDQSFLHLQHLQKNRRNQNQSFHHLRHLQNNRQNQDQEFQDQTFQYLKKYQNPQYLEYLQENQGILVARNSMINQQIPYLKKKFDIKEKRRLPKLEQSGNEDFWGQSDEDEGQYDFKRMYNWDLLNKKNFRQQNISSFNQDTNKSNLLSRQLPQVNEMNFIKQNKSNLSKTQKREGRSNTGNPVRINLFNIGDTLVKSGNAYNLVVSNTEENNSNLYQTATNINPSYNISGDKLRIVKGKPHGGNLNNRIKRGISLNRKVGSSNVDDSQTHKNILPSLNNEKIKRLLTAQANSSQLKNNKF